MAASRGLPIPLVIVCLVLIRGYSPLPTTPPFATEDYDRVEDTFTPISPDSQPPLTVNRCKYNPCLENQVPCYELREATRCSCPGFTLPDEVPEDPVISSLSWNGSEVVVRWCAPNSHISSYVVTVGGKERQKLRVDQRSAGLGVIDNISEVCVSSVNDAGRSNGDCMMYQPADHSLPLKAGLIGGALGLLLLLLLGVLLWRHRRQRKQRASISMRVTAGGQ